MSASTGATVDLPVTRNEFAVFAPDAISSSYVLGAAQRRLHAIS
jgi:hypothetical protein